MEKDEFYTIFTSQLNSLREGQIELVKQMTELSTHQKAMNGDLADVVAEIGGAPDWKGRGDRGSLRDRIHKIENDGAAAELAKQALLTSAEHTRETHARIWSIRRNSIMVALGVIGALEEILRITHVIHVG